MRCWTLSTLVALLIAATASAGDPSVNLKDLAKDVGAVSLMDGGFVAYKAPKKTQGFLWTRLSYKAPVHIAVLFKVDVSTLRLAFGDYRWQCNRSGFKLYDDKSNEAMADQRGRTPQNKKVLVEWHITRAEQSVWMDGKLLYTVPAKTSTSRKHKIGIGTDGGLIEVYGVEVHEYAKDRPEISLKK